MHSVQHLTISDAKSMKYNSGMSVTILGFSITVFDSLSDVWFILHDNKMKSVTEEWVAETGYWFCIT